MALHIETIPFTLRSGTGTQTISHVQYPGEAAKAIVFACSDNSGTSSEILSRGLSDGTTQIGIGVGFTAAFGVLCTARGYSGTYSLLTEQAQVFFGGAARRMSGYVSSLDVGSFEITLDLNNTPGAQWYATIITGDDVECKVGIYDVSAGAGSIDVNFQPAALITLGTVDVGTDGEVAGAKMNQGFATLCPNSDGDQVSWAASAAPNDTSADSYLLEGIIDCLIDNGSGTLGTVYEVSDWEAEGFALDGTFTGHWDLGYLAIGGAGVSANLVRIDQPTTTGVQNIAIQATDPVAVFFGSVCKPQSTAISADFNIAHGVYDGFSQLGHWIGQTDGTQNRDQIASTTSSIVLATATGVSTNTLNAEASVTLASENIAIDWTTVDSTAREIWALVLANNPSATSNPCGAASSDFDEITCSITITAPAPIPSIGVQQWRLHRFDTKFRREQTS